MGVWDEQARWYAARMGSDGRVPRIVAEELEDALLDATR